MGLFGAPDVDWSVTTEGGRIDAVPGTALRALISMTARDNIDARRVMAALVGTEEYQYTEREIRSTGSSSSRSWGTNEFARQEVQLAGPGHIANGETRQAPVEFAVPPDALPSIESSILRVRWKLTAWIDVGGRDPKTELQVVVPLTVAQLNPADAAAMGQQVQVVADGQPAGFWAQPAPIHAGQPFNGAVDIATPISIGDARIELKLNVSTVMGGGIPGATLFALAGFASSAENGINESQVLWRGGLSDGGNVGGWQRYLFAGQLPLAPLVTAVYPHGVATAALDVVISRRLRPDSHITRPVAIVTA
jgi:hypothetical protein